MSEGTERKTRDRNEQNKKKSKGHECESACRSSTALSNMALTPSRPTSICLRDGEAAENKQRQRYETGHRA